MQMAQDGDRNTRFFHASTIFKRKRKRIIELVDEGGNTITEPKLLKMMALDYFKNPFREELLD